MQTKVTYLAADTYTPVGIYLRLRDSFPHSLLLECTDYSSRQNAYSYISLFPIAGIQATPGKLKYTINRREGCVLNTIAQQA
jgi:anthranilate synthase component I